MPSRKADPLTLASRDTMHRYFLSVAMILCNIMDFSKYITIFRFTPNCKIYGSCVSCTAIYIVLPLQLFSTMIGLLSHSVSATCFDPSPLPLVSDNC